MQRILYSISHWYLCSSCFCSSFLPPEICCFFAPRIRFLYQIRREDLSKFPAVFCIDREEDEEKREPHTHLITKLVFILSLSSQTSDANDYSSLPYVFVSHSISRSFGRSVFYCLLKFAWDPWQTTSRNNILSLTKIEGSSYWTTCVRKRTGKGSSSKQKQFKCKER